MKLIEYIKKYGDCEVTDEIDKCIVKMPKTVYDLKDGDRYLFLTNLGTIMSAIWHNNDSDHNRLRFGNVFLTEEDAKFASKRLKVIAELKKYAKEFSDEEWEKTNLPKFYLRFDYKRHIVEVDWLHHTKVSNIYFESKEKAKEAIKWVGEDRVKKYYLGVKE